MDKNLSVYNSRQVVKWYKNLHELAPVEKKFFEEHKEILGRSRILDIGIGGGRTTTFLLPLCKDYVGIDYSENFVAAVKLKYPDANCKVMDARNLSSFESASFDMVNFSFNGIDYVDLEGRKKVFSEIARVIKSGGFFFFSTHNKNHPDFKTHPWLNSANSAFTNCKTFIKLLPFLLRKIRQEKREIMQEEYAIINDSAHNYSLISFYTTPEFLRKQLLEAGFKNISFYTKSGEKKEDSNLEDWVFVTAQKS